MSGPPQNGELETRLRKLIVTNGPAAVSSADASPKPSVPKVVAAPRRTPQRYRKFDEWQREPAAAGQSSHGQQQRRNHTSAAPSQFVPLQRPISHAFNQSFTTQCQYLEVQAQRMLPQIEMRPEEFMMKDSFRLYLERSIQAALQAQFAADAPNISLACFGSLASGFGMPGSDMDLALLSSAMPPELPRIIEKVILDMGHGAHLLTRTRVPIIKICESPTAELYQALREERQKWDNMSPEEREQHDKGTKQEEAVGDAVKTGLQTRDGADDVEIKQSSQNAGGEGTKQNMQQTDPKPDKGMIKEVPESAAEIDLKQSENPSQPIDSQLPSTTSAQITTQDSTPDEVAPLTATTTNTTTSTSTLDTKPKDPTNKPRKPWLRERKLGPLDFPKDGVGIQCDINFSNPLGLQNTTLLRCYSRCDVRVRLMILFIKSWASRRK